MDDVNRTLGWIEELAEFIVGDIDADDTELAAETALRIRGEAQELRQERENEQP